MFKSCAPAVSLLLLSVVTVSAQNRASIKAPDAGSGIGRSRSTPHVSASDSTLTASPSYTVWGQPVTITATVNDTNGSPIQGVTVQFSDGNDPQATLTAAATTDANGQTTSTLSATAIDQVTITAVAGGVTLSQTVQVNFFADAWYGNADETFGELFTGTFASQFLGPADTLSGIAFDSNGNLWSVNAGANRVLTGQGPYQQITGENLNAPAAVFVDGAGKGWVANSGAPTLSVFSSNGTGLTNSRLAPTGSLTGVTVDISGNVWAVNRSANAVIELLGAATPTPPLASGQTADTTPTTHSITGTVTGSSSASIVLSGTSSSTTTTDSSGAFTFTGLVNGSYTVTPNETAYTFAPASQSVTINGANVNGVNFTATANAAAYSISGTITPSAISSGATVNLSGTATATTTAGTNGTFSFTSLANGTYQVTPSGTSATFSPGSQSVTIDNANVTGIDFTASAASQSACGSTLNWTSSLCQQIGSGSLNPQWTVISRHGEYAQDETECNIPNALTQTPGQLSITMIASPYTCGDFNPATGAPCPSAGCASGANQAPASWPYSTGDVQWNTFNICPDCSTTTYPTATPCGGTCTITIVGSMPSYATGTWPAFWLLGQNCQSVNKYTGDTGVDGCPNVGSNQYIEIDTTECYGGQSNWCQFHVANPNFGIGNGCDALYSVSTGQHTFTTVWTSTSIQQYFDGKLETTCNQSIDAPMFFIAQIQSAAESGMMPNNANLPAVMTLNSVTVTDVNGTALFSDTFPNQN
jgi:hypothetical protein